MRSLFFLFLLLLMLLELALVYFIMPMPGSQRMNSLPLAYFLHQWRWVLRLVPAAAAGYFWLKFERKAHWSVWLGLSLYAAVCWFFNGPMSASVMFKEPKVLRMERAAKNTVPGERLVLGVLVNGQAAAYPIQYVAYHHRVLDTLGGKNIWVTYCSVCRSGRVFEPVAQGKTDAFRLVGMDHFNAMFEDQSTGSWWRQVNGEAVAGPLKGQFLPEIPCVQTSLSEWLRLHPHSKIMQPDPYAAKYYEHLKNYESGQGGSELTRSDSNSWKDKSWVAGLRYKDHARAYDWNTLKKMQLINDTIAGQSIALVLSSKGKGLHAWETQAAASLEGDSLNIDGIRYDLAGRGKTENLKPVPVYQEFWHSWKQFQPGTSRY